MSWLWRTWRTMTSWSRRPPDAHLDDELRLHLELETDRNRAAGMRAEEAARRARVRLGNRPLIAEDMRAVWRWAWLDDLRLDLRLAARLLAKHWRFSVLAVLVLALATGANTALFSVANAVLLKPLPVHEPARLVWIYGNDRSNIPYDVYRDYRDAMTTGDGAGRVRADGGERQVRRGRARAVGSRRDRQLLRGARHPTLAGPAGGLVRRDRDRRARGGGAGARPVAGPVRRRPRRRRPRRSAQRPDVRGGGGGAAAVQGRPDSLRGRPLDSGEDRRRRRGLAARDRPAGRGRDRRRRGRRGRRPAGPILRRRSGPPPSSGR